MVKMMNLLDQEKRTSVVSKLMLLPLPNNTKWLLEKRSYDKMKSIKKFIKNSHNFYLLVPKVAYDQFHRTN